VLPLPENAVTRDALERIRTMEASKFWKLRNLWHRLKRLVGLSNGVLPRYELPKVMIDEAAIDGEYAAWLDRNTPGPSDLVRMREDAKRLARRPPISIVVATHETPERYLRATLDSVLAQVYSNWELCVADDASSDQSVRRTLREYARRDPRIKLTFRSRNGGISRATNSALDLATGEFVAFLDHDDLLAPEALYEIARVLEEHPETDIVYSDEDKVDETGRLRDPHFKPDWSPESFLSRMYVGHLVACRRALVETVGRLRSEFDGSQDYDFLLRATERTERIRHLPRVLYHWRIHGASTASNASAKPYANAAAERALNEALARRGEPGRIEAIPGCPGTYSVRFAIRTPGRVSIVVPARDHGDDTRRAISSALEHTAYPNLEVLLVDNGSTDPYSLATFEELRKGDQRVRILRYDIPFNFSKIVNHAAANATGDYLLFLNNDTEAISKRWVESMVEQAQRPAIGAVGALLLYPDRTVQHAGVITGLGGVAGHSHKNFPGDAPGYYYMLKSVNNYSAVTAACMMVRRNAFESVGGFDETLAVAFNDVDFCLRLRAAGLRNVYLPHVVLYHFESKSRGLEATHERIERFSSEIARMKDRWPQLAQPDPCYSPNLTRDREDFSINLDHLSSHRSRT
jgi:GT2 family glycosyltransferase